MRMHKKRIARYGTALICAFGVALSSMPVHAEDIKSLENKTSNLQDQLDGINQDMVEISDKIAETEAQIEESNNEVFRLEASLQISRNNEEKQYENMKSRIKYMYENGSESMISMLFSADSMADLLNKADFVQNVTEYDRDMLENLVKVREGIETQLRTQRLLLIRIIVRQVTRIPEVIVHLTAILEAIPEIIMVTM